MVEAARVVVVGMRQDHVGDGTGVDTDRRQRLGRGAQEAPVAARRVERAEAGVDDPGLVVADDRPHEVVHRHRSVVRIAAEEVLAAPGVALRVLHRVDPGHRAVL